MNIEKGKSYKCLSEGWMNFTKDKIYLSEIDDYLINDHENLEEIRSNQDDFEEISPKIKASNTDCEPPSFLLKKDEEAIFDKVIEETLETIKSLLITKGKEYRRDNNPYHNFQKGSQISGIIPEKVLQGFLLKHLISVDDIINDLENEVLPTKEKVEEKFNDILVYYLIQKAQILNRL